MAQLPPKVPTMTQNWPSFPHRAMSNYLSNSIATATTTAAAAEKHHQPSWVDEFLDFTSARRGAHRRSISDSITFLETTAMTPILLDDPNNNNSGNNNSNGNNMTGFDKLDDEQLMSMFSDDMSLSLPPSSSNPSTPSDQNSNNDDQKPPAAAAAASDHQQYQQQLTRPEKEEEFPKAKIEPGLEVDSSCQQELQHHVATQQNPNSSSADTIFDPKRVKRILANRQSAQRSRVRKLQYISELERSVTTLQTEVSALSPRVAFLDHQRLILNVDNSAMKQRIAALVQDKIFKDAHQEALKKEIERLRQVYHQQNLKKMNDNNNAPSLQQQHEAPNYDPTTMPGWDKKQQVLIN